MAPHLHLLGSKTCVKAGASIHVLSCAIFLSICMIFDGFCGEVGGWVMISEESFPGEESLSLKPLRVLEERSSIRGDEGGELGRAAELMLGEVIRLFMSSTISSCDSLLDAITEAERLADVRETTMHLSFCVTSQFCVSKGSVLSLGGYPAPTWLWLP
jgi:hypothetical protein